MKTIKNTILTLGLSLMSIPAMAVYIEGQDKPVMEMVDAEILHSSHGFTGTQNVELVMTRRDGNPNHVGFLFQADTYFRGQLTPLSYELKVTHVAKAEDGATIYYASLPVQSQIQSAGHRVNLTLIDYSTSNDSDNKDFVWEASIRDGYGWCGTMDSVLVFAGDPEPIYTISQVSLPEM